MPLEKTITYYQTKLLSIIKANELPTDSIRYHSTRKMGRTKNGKIFAIFPSTFPMPHDIPSHSLIQ